MAENLKHTDSNNQSELSIPVSTHGVKSPIKTKRTNSSSTSVDRKSHGSRSPIRSKSKERQKDVVWSAIDTLDDVRKMAMENKGCDCFPENFDRDLDASRNTSTTLLYLIKARSQRIEKNIRISRGKDAKSDESEEETAEQDQVVPASKATPRKNKSSDKMGQYLSVNRSEHNIYSTDEELANAEMSDDSTDNETPSKSRGYNDSEPVYISDYTDYQANIRTIATQEANYVQTLIETVMSSTLLPTETPIPIPTSTPAFSPPSQPSTLNNHTNSTTPPTQTVTSLP